MVLWALGLSKQTARAPAEADGRHAGPSDTQEFEDRIARQVEGFGRYGIVKPAPAVEDKDDAKRQGARIRAPEMTSGTSACRVFR